MTVEITQSDWDAVTKERETGEKLPETTPPVETAPEPEASAPAAPETPADPYEGLSDEVRSKLTKFDELAATVPSLVNELREAKGRIGSLQSQWEKARRQAEQPTQTQVAAATQDPEKWAALKKDFPEWGEAITSFVETKLGSLASSPKGPTPEEIEQLVAQRTEAATQELRRQMNESLVSLQHPNWKSEVNTPEFKAWYAVQPADVQALAASDDGLDAVRMLDLFAKNKAKPASEIKDQRQQRLAAAASTTKAGSSGAPVSKAFEDMSPAEQWDYLAREREKRNAA